MIENIAVACEESGFVLEHAVAAARVAERVNCIIMFREPGKMAAGLIKEGYAMKGFRIDTKSCTWGPMAGFVCMDPRLTKDDQYIPKNKNWTHEALSGEINKTFFGDGVVDADWVGDVAPIVISQKRIDYLRAQHVISPTTDSKGHLVGTSKTDKGNTQLPWRLVPVGNTKFDWLKGALPTHHVVCVDNQGKFPFKQEFPSVHGLQAPVKPVIFRGYQAILGLCNPQTSKSLGFKACVTADYDLFAIWPGQKGGDSMANQHKIGAMITGLQPGAGQTKALGGGVARMIGVDTRLKGDGLQEHHRHGDVSARTMIAKALLNTEIRHPGGNAIHHNDEAGNFALAKGTLKDCLPIVAFLPGLISKLGNSGPETALIQTLEDFKKVLLYARESNYKEVVKPSWLTELG